MAATTVGAATEQLDLANNTARTSLTFSMKMQLQHMALAAHKHGHFVSSPSIGAVNNELSDGASLCLVCEMFRGVKGGGVVKRKVCQLLSGFSTLEMRGLLASCCMVLQAALFD